MAKDQTVVGITGKPVPKPGSAKKQYELEKKRRQEKHLGKNVGGTQYKSDVNPYYNPRQRTFREFVEIAEAVSAADKALAQSGILSRRADELQKEIDAVTSGKKTAQTPTRKRKVTKQTYIDRSNAQMKEECEIEEAKEAKPAQEVLNKIAKAYGKKHRGVNVDTSVRKSGDIRLNNIWVPPSDRGKGIGGRVMKGLGKYADKQGKKITLNQAPEPGKKKKLGDFYKSHGFQANRGKTKDFSTTDTHIRHPQG